MLQPLTLLAWLSWSPLLIALITLKWSRRAVEAAIDVLRQVWHG